MKSGARAPRFWLVGLVALIFGLALVGFLSGREEAVSHEPVEILRQPYVVPVTARDRFAARFSRGRLGWRVEEALFGRRKSVSINAHIFSVGAEQVGDVQKALGLGAPVFANSAGLKIWFLPGAEMGKVTEKISRSPEITVVSHPRIMTSEGISASMSVGGLVVLNGMKNEVGFHMECIGTFQKDSTVLVTSIFDSELVTVTNRNEAARPGVEAEAEATGHVEILTNVNIRARLEIPKGSGVVFLQGAREGSGRKALGCLIAPVQ